MSDNAKLTATLKAGQGFDSPWIVVYADTVAELTQLVADVAQQGADTYIANAAKEFQAKYAVASGGLAPQQVSSAPVAQAAPVAAPAAAPAPTPAPGSGADKQCPHGAMVLRTGTGKRGPWKGYFCPSPKGTPGQCSPQFVND